MSKRIDQNGSGSEHVSGLLSTYMDDRLEQSEQARVREHLRLCPDCQADYVELQATQRLLKSLPMETPPRAFTLTPEMVATRQGFWQRLFSPRSAPGFALGSVLAFALVAVLLVGDLTTSQASLTMSRGASQGAAVEQYSFSKDGSA